MISSLWSCRRQLPDVLPVLKANKSQYFVFVGNNPQAKQVLEFMQRPADKIAFGFQGTAGRREPVSYTHLDVYKRQVPA